MPKYEVPGPALASDCSIGMPRAIVDDEAAGAEPDPESRNLVFLVLFDDLLYLDFLLGKITFALVKNMYLLAKYFLVKKKHMRDA